VRQFLEDDPAINVRSVNNPWFTGDHIKTTSIDHETAFLGRMNIDRNTVAPFVYTTAFIRYLHVACKSSGG
jgi:hypothetical protein